jgi:RNA polymerase sigma-70 factor (ECF subfamily)
VADTDGLAEVAALVEQARSGSAQAFALIYDRYVDGVYRYLLYRVGDRATAEDLTSECFLRALRRIGDFQWTGRDIGAWLITIARNLVTDHFKSSRFRLEVSTEQILGATDRRDEGGDIAEIMVRRAEAEVLYGALGQLRQDQREVVFLRFIQGMSVGEVARVLGKSDGAIKALQYRAMQSLLRILTKDKGKVGRDHLPPSSLEQRDMT